MSRARFLTSSLATVAVASALTFSGTAAHAAPELSRATTQAVTAAQQGADEVCGQPSTPDQWGWVDHEETTVVIPSETHDEWTWTRAVPTTEHKYRKLVAPEQVKVIWKRTWTSPVQHLYHWEEVLQEFQPAVPEVEEEWHWETEVVEPAVTSTVWLYIHDNTGAQRWEREDWGAQNGQGSGWKKTDQSKPHVIKEAVTKQVKVVDVERSPAVPEVPRKTKDHYRWATEAPGPEWTATDKSRGGKVKVEYEATRGEQPGKDWVEVKRKVVKEAVYDEIWAPADSAPAGYERTDDSRPGEDSLESVQSADAPEGEGWVKDEASVVTVVDSPESEKTIPAWKEWTLINPGTEPTAPCDEPAEEVAGPTEDGTDDGADEETSVGGPTAPGSTSAVAGPVENTAQAPSQAAPAAGATVAPTSGTSTAVLPATGNDASIQTALTGLGAVLAGAWLMLRNRRRTAA